mmetsp:Transcript_8096/g.25582  ORF Transcript_8096/g.25582 Transcript_8096/m.25582 type:complete len:210 (+) Transcript_8096:198-827(+)
MRSRSRCARTMRTMGAPRRGTAMAARVAHRFAGSTIRAISSHGPSRPSRARPRAVCSRRGAQSRRRSRTRACGCARSPPCAARPGSTCCATAISCVCTTMQARSPRACAGWTRRPLPTAKRPRSGHTRGGAARSSRHASQRGARSSTVSCARVSAGVRCSLGHCTTPCCPFTRRPARATRARAGRCRSCSARIGGACASRSRSIFSRPR